MVEITKYKQDKWHLLVLQLVSGSVFSLETKRFNTVILEPLSRT